MTGRRGSLTPAPYGQALSQDGRGELGVLALRTEVRSMGGE